MHCTAGFPACDIPGDSFSRRHLANEALLKTPHPAGQVKPFQRDGICRKRASESSK
jgi:hypothetical protein